MADLGMFKAFNLSEATASLWIFKKSTREGTPVFTGRWVQTTEALDAALKEAIAAERDRITELQEYTLLAQTNEASALTITTLETHAGLIVDQAGDEVAGKQIERLKEIQNAHFYVVKLVSGDDVMHAVRKTDSSWRTKKARGVISAFFSDEQLGLNQNTGFDISKEVDFFIFGEDIIISKKVRFESVLNYKAAHQNDFVELQGEDEFGAVFSSLEALLEFVGENKTQLRRASAIRQKGHYKDANFMQNLRDHHLQFGLNLTFDADGKIVATLESCRDIFQALLDHRLTSVFSNNIYDVPDASNVIV